MKGLFATCLDGLISKRDSYVAKTGGGTVFQIRFEGLGFGHTFMTRDASVADKWPKPGDEVDVVVKLETDFENKLRMGDPMFTLVKDRARKQPAA